MIKLEMKNYNMILTEKQQKYQHYQQPKLTNMNVLQVKKYRFLIKEEKQLKIKKNNKKHLKSMENNQLNLMKLLKMILVSTELTYHFKSKKKYLIKI